MTEKRKYLLGKCYWLHHW